MNKLIKQSLLCRQIMQQHNNKRVKYLSGLKALKEIVPAYRYKITLYEIKNESNEYKSWKNKNIDTMIGTIPFRYRHLASTITVMA